MADRDTVVYVKIKEDTDEKGKPKPFEFQYNSKVYTWASGKVIGIPYWLAEHARTVHAIGQPPRIELLSDAQGEKAAREFAVEEAKAKSADLKEKAKALLEEAKAQEAEAAKLAK